ncbi:hypothetical protein BZA70DRAFT_277245 [Myxozyma melibiosi]|uniref:Centromere protein H C-terminal domain-containing protein n=1 Tax=Myxozyma melibiosi TaxID=54550 RepID=A0ABR1F9M6_9ASCO
MSKSKSIGSEVTRYLHLAHTYRHAQHDGSRVYSETELDRVIAQLENKVEAGRREVEKFRAEEKGDEGAGCVRAIVAARRYTVDDGGEEEEEEDDAERIVRELEGMEKFEVARGGIESLEGAIASAKKELEREEKTREELRALGKLLDARQEYLREKYGRGMSERTRVEVREVRKARGREEESRKKMRRLMVVLKKLLDTRIAEVLVEEENGAPVGGFVGEKRGGGVVRPRKLEEHWTQARSEKIAAEAKQLVENLLNEAFLPEQGWVELEDADSVVVRLLIRSDIAVLRANDGRYMKLREFASSF